MKPVTNVIICGTGGQGILLASEILCEAARLAGNDVKKSEVHGMAQRGGSVSSHVRFGEKVYSPLVEKGCRSYPFNGEDGGIEVGALPETLRNPSIM